MNDRIRASQYHRTYEEFKKFWWANLSYPAEIMSSKSQKAFQSAFIVYPTKTKLKKTKK